MLFDYPSKLKRHLGRKMPCLAGQNNASQLSAGQGNTSQSSAKKVSEQITVPIRLSLA